MARSERTPRTGREMRSAWPIAGSVALAWLGMYIHNVAELPNLTWASAENVLPALVWLILFGLWWAIPARSLPTVLLLAWALLNLVGGFATVLPLAVLPFAPEQSVRHYAFHLLYAVAQLPLLALLWRKLREVRFQSNSAGEG
jgi:hypothetical protein